nr:hypothetical protein [Methylomagnum ishizawai]
MAAPRASFRASRAWTFRHRASGTIRSSGMSTSTKSAVERSLRFRLRVSGSWTHSDRFQV